LPSCVELLTDTSTTYDVTVTVRGAEMKSVHIIIIISPELSLNFLYVYRGNSVNSAVLMTNELSTQTVLYI
jgi:hypothetical protein